MRSSTRARAIATLLAAAFLAVHASGDASANEAAPFEASKQAAVASVDANREELIRLADAIWEHAELALREERSAALLADALEQHGFAVERGVAGMPTAFVASFGGGRPIIGVLGEYDALPGISQEAAPRREALVEGGAGHGCGHNLLGTGALGAAFAIKDLIAAGKLSGTIRYYGTPAEENIGGKAYMVRAGLFDDVDAALSWHPDYEIAADTGSSQAMLDLLVSYRGNASHAAFDPWNGRSALDGVELFLHAINLMREHVRPTVRMHYTIPSAGAVPNVVPEQAVAWLWVRDSTMARVDEVVPRVKKAAEGAALATGTEMQIDVQAGSYEILVNFAGERVLQGNLEWLGGIEYDDTELRFARELQESSGVKPTGMKGDVKPFEADPDEPSGGSTDLAEVSWVVPTIHLTAPTAPADVTWHAWPVVASGRTSIGHKGMLYSARALATTIVDLMSDPAHLTAMRAEFVASREGLEWTPRIPEGPPTVPSE